MRYNIPASVRNAESKQVIIVEWDNNTENIECFEKLISSYSEIQIKNIMKKNLSIILDKYNNAKKFETKIKYLVEIVLHCSVESYRFLENESKNEKIEKTQIAPYLKLALLLSKGFLEQSLLDNNSFVPIFIFSGLGGRENKIKYFVSIFYAKNLLPNEAKYILLELSNYIASKFEGELELFDTNNNSLSFYVYIKYNLKIVDVFNDIEKFISKITLNKVKDIKISNDKEEIKKIIIKNKCQIKLI